MRVEDRVRRCRCSFANCIYEMRLGSQGARPLSPLPITRGVVAYLEESEACGASAVTMTLQRSWSRFKDAASLQLTVVGEETAVSPAA